MLHGGHPAVALHEEEGARVAHAAEGLLQPFQVGRGPGRDVGVHRRRRGTLVLSHDGGDAGGEDHRNLRQEAAENPAGMLFVRAVQVGIEKADRDRLHALAGEFLSRRTHVRLLQRRELGAVPADPPPHREAETALGENGRVRRAVVPYVVADPPPERERVAKTARDQKAHLRPLPGEQGVRRNRRSMDKPPAPAEEGAGVHPEGGGGPLQGAEDAAVRILGLGGRLDQANQASRGVGHDEVGEGTPHVHADPVPFAHPSGLSFFSFRAMQNQRQPRRAREPAITGEKRPRPRRRASPLRTRRPGSRGTQRGPALLPPGPPAPGASASHRPPGLPDRS